MIRPSIWTDGKFMKLSIEAAFTFIGMISLADDEGFVIGNTESLRVSIFGARPVTEDQMESWINEICANGKKPMMRRIIIDPKDEEDGTVYWFPNWKKHQTVNRPTKSFIREKVEALGISLNGGAQGALSLEQATPTRPEPDSAPKRQRRPGPSDPGKPVEDPNLYANMLREDVGALCDRWAARFAKVTPENQRTITPGLANKILMTCRSWDWNPEDLLSVVPIKTRNGPINYIASFLKKKTPPERQRSARESNWLTWSERPGRKFKPSAQSRAAVDAMVASIGRSIPGQEAP